MSENSKCTRRNFIKTCSLLPVVFLTKKLHSYNILKPEEQVANYNFKQKYIELYNSGELKERVKSLYKILNECNLCPRNCRVNRMGGKTGICKAGKFLKVGFYGSSYEEEKELINKSGSGAIRLSHCNLLCDFCITAQESHEGGGKFMYVKNLSKIMLEFQKMGCPNINFYTPTHFSPHVLHAIYLSIPDGLNIPIIYNTSIYEELHFLKFLENIVSIYIADFKFFNNNNAGRYAHGALNYPDTAKKALLAMQKQVGTAIQDPDGIIRKGLIIRHLILPNNSEDSKCILKWIADNLPHNTYINLIPNYHPYYNAYKYKEINRNITKIEYEDVINEAHKLGLRHVIYQNNYFNL